MAAGIVTFGDVSRRVSLEIAMKYRMKGRVMRYPGGKGGAGVYQTIINNIPPHTPYIETHLGDGNILERKRPAGRSIGIDRDLEVIAAWRQMNVPGLELHCGDAVAWLESYSFTGAEFVYADPPYVLESRRGGKLYRYEYSDADHVSLLAVLAGLPCAAKISGYDNAIYAGALAAWRTIEFNAMTHAGLAIERL
jgi:site-specific DNA-adenine methylase